MPQSLEPYPPKPIDPEAIEKALTIGDVSKMDSPTRVQFYRALCASCGLNPLTRPFILMKAPNNELHWYATVGAAEQLRKLHRVSTRILGRETIDGDLYEVTVQASTPDGRCEEAQGIVALGGLKGQELGNARMKAQSKALRRATLALIGLGFAAADEERGPVVPFDPQTGAVTEPQAPLSAATLLPAIGQWLRTQPKAAREQVAQVVWGMRLQEMPHASLEDLAAGWHLIDQGTAPLPWDSPTLAEDVRQWQKQHADAAGRDVFDWADGSPEPQEAG